MISLLAWNIRGVGDRSLPRLIKDLVNRHKVNLLALYETRISGETALRKIARLGFDSWFRVDATGFSGGICILWDSACLNVEILASHTQYVHMRCGPTDGSQPSLITCVYASPTPSVREALWGELRRIAGDIRDPWIAVGDFNAYLQSHEKAGVQGQTSTIWRSLLHASLIVVCGIWGTKGHPSRGKVVALRRESIEECV